jgi:hypothetical protein
MKTLLFYPPSGGVKIEKDSNGKDVKTISYVIPEGIETIRTKAFYKCQELIEITLPTTLKSIEEKAFFRCSITEIILPDGDELHVVYPNGHVEGITVTVKGDQMSYPDYTVFMAYEMADNDAVVLHLPAGQADKVNISYLSNSKPHELSLTQ